MLTPRSTLIRRIAAALDASPSRIPVLVGGCGSGRTTVLHQLRDRIGRTVGQYIDVERTATTPERFVRAVTGASPFPAVDPATPTTPRAAFDQALGFLSLTRAGGSEPATFLLDEFLELRTFESFPGLRRVLHDLVDGLGTSGNRFVLTSRYTARALRLLRDRSARFEVIHIPPVTAEDTVDILGPARAGRCRRGIRGSHGARARRRPALVCPRPRRRASCDGRSRERRRQRARRVDGNRAGAWRSCATSATSCVSTGRAATGR